MIRTLLWFIGGLLLGGVIHIITILALPLLAEETTWTRIAAFDAKNRVVVRLDVDRVRSWDHRKLGMPAMELGGSTAAYVE